MKRERENFLQQIISMLGQSIANYAVLGKDNLKPEVKRACLKNAFFFYFPAAEHNAVLENDGDTKQKTSDVTEKQPSAERCEVTDLPGELIIHNRYSIEILAQIQKMW